jgi:hypothetical protein
VTGDDTTSGDDTMSGDQEYRGAATVRAGAREVTVPVRLSARLEPIDGRYRWAGRTGPDDDLLARVRSGMREVSVTVPGGRTVTARAGEPDPWGGIRLSGTGTPPWIPA